MGLYQSYQQTFVTNSSALLPEGKTVESLAVGQIGILDGKTYKGVTSPTYGKNKALYFVWGTPNVDGGDFGGMPNENEYTKLIKGKLIKDFRAKKAKRGQTPVYTVGWSGDNNDTDSLTAKVGQSKSLFIKLSGTIIDRLYDKTGFIKELVTVPACIECAADCGDNCADVLGDDLAYQLVEQINSDKDLKKFIKAKALVDCTGITPPVETTGYKFALNVADAGDQAAFGLIQSFYPNETLSILDRVGITTKYGVTESTNVAPAAYTGVTETVPDCDTCPTGYTLQIAANVFDVSITTAADPTFIASLPGYISKTGPVASGGTDHYTVLVSTNEDKAAFIAAVVAENGAYTATFTVAHKEKCLLTTPVNITWVADGTVKQQTKEYTITLADTVCGVARLADLQAAYPDLTIAAVDASGACVHTFSTTVKSNFYETGCAIDEVIFVAPAMFEGVEWKAVPAAAPAAGATCKAGIQIETSFFNKKTNECTFSAFPYENDVVHIQISNYNPDFNASPCEGEWAVKQIRQVEYPQGHGAFIQKLEQESKAYDARTRAYDAVVREVQGYSFQADATKFYDQYTLEFDTVFFTSGGWSEKYSESFSLNLFVPEGQGDALEAAINSYLQSSGVDIDPVVLP